LALPVAIAGNSADMELYYYAAVLIGRITGLARPSVRLSVCCYCKERPHTAVIYTVAFY